MIYFIECGATGRIKIGKSRDPNMRLTALRTGSSRQLRLLASFDGPGTAEKILHRQFKRYRASGEGIGDEWFEPADELLLFIKDQAWNGMDFSEPGINRLPAWDDDGRRGDRPRAARLEAEMSQAKAASNMAGQKPTVQYWSDIERGRRQPSLEWLWQAAQALGCDPHSLDERLQTNRGKRKPKG